MKPSDIRALREALKMTQDEFARHIGMQTRGAVSRLETGDREPTGPLLRLLQILREQENKKSR